MNTGEDRYNRLADALAGQFSREEAERLARLVNAALQTENIYTEQIPLAEKDMPDCLLMAFEERILIPVRSHQTGTWADRMLQIIPGEMFFMPHVARIFFEETAEKGTMDAESAVRRVLSHHPPEHIDQAVSFLKKMKPHTDSCVAEGGLMTAVAKKAGITTEVHDIVDACVVAGIMSPCTRAFSMQGLAWYEFHPCLYWDPRFQ